MEDKFITGTIAYRTYGIPRSMLRELAEQGVIRSEERTTGGPFVLKLYSEADIKDYLNNN